MFRAEDYVKVDSLSEAYELCQKRSSLVVGGMVWLKMTSVTKRTIAVSYTHLYLYRLLYRNVSRLLVNNACMLLCVGFIMLTRLSMAKGLDLSLIHIY